jgi:anti-anti-sigma factor
MRATSSGRDVEVLRLSGRFDANSTREFKTLYEPLLQDRQVHIIEVNLGAIEYIDSSALGMLLLLRDRALRAAKKVVLSNCRGTILDVLEVANFNAIFELS